MVHHSIVLHLIFYLNLFNIDINLQVLDAPDLQDDFYLNLVDWSSENVLAVGLGSSVYLWSASSSDVTRLCDLAPDDNTITSVAWNDKVSTTISFLNFIVFVLLSMLTIPG